MTNPNDTAYPYTSNNLEEGLTKRELFAAMAMQGILANPDPDLVSAPGIALIAVEEADSLIKELNKTKP